MTYPFGETVVQIPRRKSGRNGLNNDVYVDGAPITYQNIAVWPRDGNSTSANEDTYGAERVIIGLGISLPPGSQVSAEDRFQVRGETYEVDGDPQEYRSPFTGWNPGLPLSLTRVTG